MLLRCAVRAGAHPKEPMSDLIHDFLFAVPVLAAMPQQAAPTRHEPPARHAIEVAA